eukprot:scaffold34409_cov61-Phaeocystis_antarctica.AAC.2
MCACIACFTCAVRSQAASAPNARCTHPRHAAGLTRRGRCALRSPSEVVRVVIEACLLAVVSHDGLVVLGVSRGQLVALLLLPVGGPRLLPDVDLLVARVLEAQQEEGDGAERRLHPPPRPRAHLEHGVEIGWLRHVRGHGDLVELLRELQGEDGGYGHPRGADGSADANVIRQQAHRQALGILARHATHDLQGVIVADVVDDHHLAHQALP